MARLIETWSTEPEQEDLMGDHAWIWREMIRTIELPEHPQAQVLEIGCNLLGLRYRVCSGPVLAEYPTGWPVPCLVV